MQQKPFSIAQALTDAVNLHRQGQLREAEKLYARVLKAQPGNFDALHLSGLAKAQSGQMGEAYRLMSAALKINPRAADAWTNLANVLHALKREPEALDAAQKALALRPDDATALTQRANALLALDRPQEALAGFDALLARNPRHIEARLNRGVALATLGRPVDALAEFDAVLRLAPLHVDAAYNRGNVLHTLGRVSEAIAAFDRALARAPEHAKAWNNRGRSFQALDRHADAIASFEKAIAVDKDYADAHFNLSLSLLSAGDLPRGFAEYEWRWRRTGMDGPRKPGRPLWLGEYPLGTRSILLHAEQGLGDTIQFVRYAPMLARAGARVILEVQSELKPLLATLDGVASCHARGEPLPVFDVHCPLASLPLALKTDAATIPADIPYLRADEDRLAKWRPRLDALSGKRVALAWAGHARHANDRNRSMALEALIPLTARPDVSFVSIQRELRDGDAEHLARAGVLHVGDTLADMADTAAVVALADLVIAVDTSVVHLAGALGRPVWVMLPYAPDWRWMLSREHTPWYPQARLFRQDAHGDWASVIAAVGAGLADFSTA
ncbi:MAG: tetratricopeptide repeat protein [Pseudolabrys sp.]